MSFATTAIHRTCTAQATIATPLGALLLARTVRGLAGAWFEGQKYHAGALAAPDRPDDPLLRAAADQLGDYFAGRSSRFDVPLDLHGTDFQRGVWQALLAIVPGQTSSYLEVARRVGSPHAVRAVGAAVGKNPLSVIVPCHRVVGSNGSLTGYAGGLHRKRALLALEGIRSPDAIRVPPPRIASAPQELS
jgi:methylated-DNA-[protein]-cysteine S-methyltransferase